MLLSVAAAASAPRSRMVHMVSPRASGGVLSIDDPSLKWEAVTPNADSILLQEDEGVGLDVTPPTAVSCSAETGCSCKTQYYYGHIDTSDCGVYVPEQYQSSQLACQYFVKGGALFLYGDKW